MGTVNNRRFLVIAKIRSGQFHVFCDASGLGAEEVIGS